MKSRKWCRDSAISMLIVYWKNCLLTSQGHVMFWSLYIVYFCQKTFLSADDVRGAVFASSGGTLWEIVNISTSGLNVSLDVLGATTDLQLLSITDNVKVNQSDLDPQSFSTTSTVTVKPTSLPVRRDIYIRGHLLRQPARSTDSASSKPLQRTFIRDFRTVPEPEMDYQDGVDSDNGTSGGHFNSTVRRKVKDHFSSKYFKSKTANEYTEHEVPEHGRSRESQYYTLLYIVGILIISSLVTLSACLVFGLCRAHIKKRLEQRRRFDKSGEYERVDSVSSVVDSTCSQIYHDEPIEDITII